MNMIIDKPKKKRNQLKYYRNKCDKLYQEMGRDLDYGRGCLVCSGTLSCLHHYIPKSRSTHLRYNLKNGIPICQSCHFKLHNSDPTIQNEINRIKGDDWIKEIEAEYRKGIGMSAGVTYYKEMYKKLSLLKPYVPST